MVSHCAGLETSLEPRETCVAGCCLGCEKEHRLPLERLGLAMFGIVFSVSGSDAWKKCEELDRRSRGGLWDRIQEGEVSGYQALIHRTRGHLVISTGVSVCR